MMCVSTPSNSPSTNFKLSPPPTPGPKRTRYMHDFGVVPMFFPSSCSLLFPEEIIDSNENDNRESRSSSHHLSFNNVPAPNMSLRARPLFGTTINRRIEEDIPTELQPDQMPSLPFSFSESNTSHDAFATNRPSAIRSSMSPRGSDSSSSSMSSSMKGLSISSAAAIATATATAGSSSKSARSSKDANQMEGGHKKIPSFKTSGMFHDRRRNSVNARCA